MNHFDHTLPTDHRHNHQVQLVVGNDPNVTANAGIMDVNNQQQPIHLMVNLSNGNNSTATTVPFDNHHQQQPNYHHPDSNTASNETIDSTTTASYAYYTYDSCGQLTPATGVGTSATATPFQVSWNKVELIQQPSQMTTQQSDWYHNQQQQSRMLTSNEQSQQTAILVPGSTMPGNVTTNFVTTAANFNQQQQQQFVDTDHTNIQPIQISLVPTQSSVQTHLQPTQTSKAITKKTQKRTTNSKQSGKGEGRQSKPVSAYALFFRDTQASIKTENPSASFGEISKIVASKWEILAKEDKIVYKERADMEKKNYLQNLASNKAKEIAQTNHSTPPLQQTSTESSIHLATIPPSISNQQQITNSDDLTAFESVDTEPSMDMLVAADEMLTESSIPVDAYHQTAYSNYSHQQQPQTTMNQANTYHHHHHSALNNPSTSNVIDSFPHAELHHHPHLHQHSSQQHMHHFIHSNDTQLDNKTHHSTRPSSSTFPFADDDDQSAVSFFVNSSDAEQNLIDLGIDLNDFDDINLLNDENIYSPTNSSTTNSLFDTVNPVVGVDPFLSSLEQTTSDHHHHHHHHHQQPQSSATNDPILTSTYASDSILQDSYPQEMIYEPNGRTPDIDQQYENSNNNFLPDSSSSAVDHDPQNELDSSVIESDTTLMNGDNNNLGDHQHHNEQSSICARDGCQRTTIDSNQWDREFCSEECCVRYCSDVFRNWTTRKQQQMSTDMSQHVLTSSASSA
ncbi:TOX high mobility group box member 4 [Dermatophagoides pteronyssinus]|nr:TOX high mobility group box member 4 [Dermatophagoides pteronyssinus]